MAAAEEMEMEMGFEATELRLGLPSSREEAEAKNSSKRGFLETMDLNLKLETSDNTVNSTRIATVSVNEGMKRVASKKCLQINSNIDDPAKPSAPKSQVVGWPPVRSYRKNIMSEKGSKEESGSAQAAFVKVSMDGAPYLRKVELKVYRSYQELYISLEKMFSSSTIHFMNGSKIMDLLNGSEYVPTYEDKDGDWMLVGDVPWEMFVESCKRLRIMKGSEAIGLAPRAVEKCKDQS